MIDLKIKDFESNLNIFIEHRDSLFFFVKDLFLAAIKINRGNFLYLLRSMLPENTSKPYNDKEKATAQLKYHVNALNNTMMSSHPILVVDHQFGFVLVAQITPLPRRQCCFLKENR